jgi:hypothetical protein
MRTCIWCCKTDKDRTFNRDAHTFPKSLGGKNICSNVCDSCNSFFGSSGIETVFKEVLNTSKYLILSSIKKPKSRYKSEYFDIDFEKRRFKYKLKYKLKSDSFKKELGKRFRQGLFKVFLEERERLLGDARNERFNFIRNFSRYNLGNYPVFIWQPINQILISEPLKFESPELEFSDYNINLDKEFRMFEYSIMGHFFSLPTSDSFEYVFKNYCEKKLSEGINKIYVLKAIESIEDIDFRFNYLNI